MNAEDLDMMGRLCLSALLGGLIGLERELHHQPAGLRTHMIVALGSCLIMLVSMHMTDLTTGKSDPARISAQVVTGIGFLGAGAIMRSGLSVRGLTTAACLWTVAGIGLATGCGYWKGAVATTALVLIATYLFQKLETKMSKGRFVRRFVVQARDSATLVSSLEDILQKSGIAVQEIDLQRDLVAKRLQVTITAHCREDANVDVLSRSFSSVPEVEKVDIE